MYRDTERQRHFTRRAAVLAGGKLVVMSILAGRMYQLQVVESDRYRVLAEDNRINFRVVAPPRGRILDRFGAPLAVNRENYRVLLIAERTDDITRTLGALDRLIGLTEAERRRILREVGRRRPFVPVTVRAGLDWSEVSVIEVNAPDLPGVTIDVGRVREYPHSVKTAHVLGYVAAVSESELTGDPLLELPGFRIGKGGIEKTREAALRGKAGSRRVEINAVGRVIRELDRDDGVPGGDVRLTLDLPLQTFIQDQLAHEQSAAAVLIGVETGDILAIASTPSFEPNQFVRGLSAETWKSVISDPLAPLTNKAIAGAYAPGSTFKMVVALAALEAGVTRPERRVFCSGVTRLGQASFHCWNRYGHGWLDMVDALMHSCDVYYYDLAMKVGIDRISAMAIRLGLGSTLLDALPGERAGLVPTRAWKLATLGERWQRGETLIAGIGQGFLLATPLQLAVMTARVASGRAVLPRLIQEASGGAGARGSVDFPPLDIPARALGLMRRGMDAVANDKRGTAYKYAIRETPFELAGKTGTSQVRRISRRERASRVLKNHELPWRERDHALFVAYAPVETPRYAVAVVVEHGGSGSSTAVPIASDILLRTQRRDPLGEDAARRLAAAPGPGRG